MTQAGRLNIRDKTDLQQEIDRAAAQDALLNRTIFAISLKAYAEFLARVDAPPEPNERLKRSLQTPAPWER